MRQGTYRFHDFVVDLDRMALLRRGDTMDLRPKAFDALVALLERQGQVVSKDELVAVVWPDVIVNDDALAQCIRDVRKAISDVDQTMIQTVPRRGYMFALPVQRDDAAEVPARRAGRRWWPMAVGAVLVAVAATAWLFYPTPDPPAPFARTPQATVAVLPFDTGGEEGEAQWISEGLADDIIMAMSRFRDLAIVARTSSFAYRHAELPTIRTALGADFAVQGSVRRVDDRLRLAVQMVDLHTGINRWAERFERPYADLPTVLDEVSSGLVTALVAQARDAVVERTTGAENLSAYELTMKARRALLAFERQQAFDAMSLIEAALEADPAYAVAWDLLAQLQVQFFIQPYDARQGDPATLSAAREAAARAMALDPSYSTPRATMGGLLARQGDYEGALDVLRQALELNPNDSTALATFADILDRSGDHTGSLAAWQALARIDPVGPTLNLALTSRAQLFTGNIEEAFSSARACELRAPQFQPCLVFLVLSAAAIGDEQLARETAERLLAVNPRFTVEGHFRTVPLRRAEDIALMRNYLLMAGLPEN